ncbi:hypothetical protein [Pararhizobium sp.]|uniref:hypothetical protein n=1 Tax=Pararhizobium sp. TaxID=1977563 RepID=UPI003D0F2163
MATNFISTATIQAVQNYWEKRWMDQDQRDWRTPLADNSLGIPATIPKNRGQYVEFRKFDHFGAADTLFAENAEPASGEALVTTTIQVPVKEMVAYVGLGNLLKMTDPIDLMNKCMDMLRVGFRRGAHRITNNALVNSFVETVHGVSFNNSPLPTMFAGNLAGFGSLVEDSYHTMMDFKRARSRMENDGVPKPFPEGYCAVISSAIRDQLMDDDENFRDIIKRIPSQSMKTFGNLEMPVYEGLVWKIQDDEYRCNLLGDGGALATRADTGRVHVAHVLGKGAYGYVEIAGTRRLSPQFKVQDITITGFETTIGARIPFMAGVLDPDFGINIAGTTKYYQGVNGDITVV